MHTLRGRERERERERGEKEGQSLNGYAPHILQLGRMVFVHIKVCSGLCFSLYISYFICFEFYTKILCWLD